MVKFTFTIITLLFIITLSAKESLLPAKTVKLVPVEITLSDNHPCLKNVICAPHAQETKKNLSKPVINFPLLQQSITWHYKGEVQRRLGIGILIPSTFFAIVSTASIAVSFIFIPNNYDTNYDGSINDYSVSWDFLFPIFLIPGIIGLVVNGSLMAVGIVKIKRGNRMMSEAEEMKKKSYKLSFNITPIIAPKSKTYGVMLSLRY